VYDAADRLKEAHDPLRETGTDKFTSYTYDSVGNRILARNNRNIETQYVYDGIDRLTQVKEDYYSTTSSAPTANTKTTYGYDGINQTSITDHDNHTTSYEYDHASHLKKVTYPSPGGHVDYTYDAADLHTRTDQRGIVTTYGYNDLHQLTSRVYDDGTARTENFGFDRSGRLTSATNADCEVIMTYDDAGRVETASQEFVSDQITYDLSYDYLADNCDYVGRTVTYPGSGGREVTHEMNERLSGVSMIISDGNLASWTFDEANRRTDAYLANGVSTSFDYDINNRLKNIQHAKDSTKLFDVDYGYDEVGNRLFKRFNSVNSTNNMTSRSEVYDYDNRDRLKQMQRGTISSTWPEGEIDTLNHSVLAFNQSWTDMDRRGNWKEFKQWVGSALNNPGVTRTTTVYATNQYETIDPDGPATGSPTCTSGCTAAVTPTYDYAGNLTLDPTAWPNGGLEFMYDEENRLTKVKRASDHATLQEIVYDAIGRRVESIEYWDAAANAALSTPRHTRHIFDGLQTIQEHVCDTSSTCSGWQKAREFIWGDSARFPEPIAMIDNTDAGIETQGTPEPFYYLHDALGSVIGLTDEAGTLVERYTYDPYGKTFIERKNVSSWAANGGSGGAPAYSAYGNPFMWTGQRYDPAVSLYHFLYRSYSSNLGRWLQQDREEYADGINLYQYTTSKPIIGVDPWGTITVFVTGFGGGSSKSSNSKGSSEGSRSSDSSDDCSESSDKSAPSNEEVSGLGKMAKDKEIAENVPGKEIVVRHQDQEEAKAAIREAHKNNPDEPIVVIGHSFGGDSAIEIVEDLAEEGIEVQLVIQIDSVGVGDEELPNNAQDGVNIYSTSREGVNGATHVEGSRNIGLDGTSHTEIDDDPRTTEIVRRYTRRFRP
jgi:RHS repeat-associated protein